MVGHPTRDSRPGLTPGSRINPTGARVRRAGSMPYWRLFYHLVWATKGRKPLIGSEEEAVILRSLQLTFDDLDVIPHAVGIMPNHVHVAVSAPPKISPADLVRRMKGASTHAINEEIARWKQSPFAWQGEYGVHSFSDQALHTVISYVTNQQAHHSAKDLWAGLVRIADNTTGSQSSRRSQSRRIDPSRLEPTSVTEPGT